MDDRERLRRLESFYAESAHPWGEEPNDFVVAHVDELQAGTVLDLGVGDGRNALFLARRGFEVVGVDVVQQALDTLLRSAAEEGLEIETYRADLADTQFDRSFANVVCTVTLHFLVRDDAVGLIGRAKEWTVPGGVHVLSDFTKDGPLYRPEADRFFWLEPGGLRGFYDDWEVLHSASRVVPTATRDDDGNPLRQPLDELVVRKPAR